LFKSLQLCPQFFRQFFSVWLIMFFIDSTSWSHCSLLTLKSSSISSLLTSRPVVSIASTVGIYPIGVFTALPFRWLFQQSTWEHGCFHRIQATTIYRCCPCGTSLHRISWEACLGQSWYHVQPVLQIVIYVVAYERQHSKRVTAYLSDFVWNCGSRNFRTHDWTHEYTMVPVKAFMNKRNGVRTASTDKDCWNRHTFRILPFRSNYRHWLAGAVKRPLGCAAKVPESGVQSLPCQSMRWAGGSVPMPSHQTSPSSVNATFVNIVFS